jgi:hypothetical protein
MSHYRELNRERNQIRILKLEPGSGDSIVCCTLQHAYIDVSPPPLYETISYVCGDPKAKAMIRLHGSETEVMATSEAALRRMRLPNEPRIVWIDSICINQQNLEERGHQVGMMYLIYSKTSEKLIWLDLDNGTAAKAIAWMQTLLDEMTSAVRGTAELSKLLFNSQGGNLYSREPFAIDIKQSAIPQFFENTWFLRLWVVQEASLAPSSTCHCGAYTIPLTDVLRVAIWLRYKYFQLPIMTEAQDLGTNNAMTLFHSADKDLGHLQSSPRSAMENCLRVFRNFETVDPKDHVFAILGLWQKFARQTNLPPILKPDYRNSAPVEVFRNATRFAILESGNLRFLRQFSQPVERKDCVRWPSWVPSLDSQIDTTSVHGPLLEPFNADGREPMALLGDDSNLDVLTVSGVHVDEVIGAIPALAHDDTSDMLQAAIAAMMEVEGPSNHSWVHNPVGGFETKLGSVLQGGYYRDTRVSALEALHGFQSFRKLLEHRISKDVKPGSMYENEIAARFEDGLCHAAWDRAGLFTREGHIGLGPRCTQPGDVVAILYGLHFPVVMKALNGHGDFRSLGTSYVYGIMDGEAVREHKATGLGDVIFNIV